MTEPNKDYKPATVIKTEQSGEKEDVKKALSEILKRGRKPHEIVKSLEETIEAKDKEIADLKQKYDQSDREADHWERKYIMSDAKVQAQAEQLSEKDATISKLMALLKELHGELTHSVYKASFCTEENIERMFNEFCKENGIDLGGE